MQSQTKIGGWGEQVTKTMNVEWWWWDSPKWKNIFWELTNDDASDL